jgi:hypothetical protein
MWFNTMQTPPVVLEINLEDFFTASLEDQIKHISIICETLQQLPTSLRFFYKYTTKSNFLDQIPIITWTEVQFNQTYLGDKTYWQLWLNTNFQQIWQYTAHKPQKSLNLVITTT